MEKLAIISLGNNIGNWKIIFDSAMLKIAELGAIDFKSSVYKTEPWGLKEQPWFKNQVIGILTTKSPLELLSALLKIESELGRVRNQEQHWGPRTLDLDIILFEEMDISNETLTIPHPRMHERNFILQPLSEIYPELIHPTLNLTISELTNRCKDQTKIEKINNVL